MLDRETDLYKKRFEKAEAINILMYLYKKKIDAREKKRAIFVYCLSNPMVELLIQG